MPFPPTSSETPIIEQAHADVSEVDTPKPQGLLRRLYNWVLSWADSPHGMIALAGISFAVGMLVDNSIVVLENIDRHRKLGKTATVVAVEANTAPHTSFAPSSAAL